MHVAFGDAARDDRDFPSEEICAYYERTRELPKTSGSTPEDFIRVFDQIHEEHPEARILYLASSSATTCSYQSAQMAAEELIRRHLQEIPAGAGLREKGRNGSGTSFHMT